MRLTVLITRFSRKKINLLGFVFLIGLSSCVTNEMVTYLQEQEDSPYSGEFTPPEDYLIKPNDNLYIRVTTLDPSYANIFNAMGDQGYMTADEASAHLLSYPVENDGTVDLPYVGIIEVAGKTIKEAKQAIETVLAEYVTDASLTVKLVNNYVSVVGEVREPGLYPIYKDRLNVYQALSMAGDVADYGNRYEVSIIRQTDGESKVKEFDITDKKIIDSEFYYVMPNDVIYVKPLKGRYFAVNTSPYMFAFTAIAALGTLVVLIQNTRLLSQ
ncbi:MAG: polysaccharide biosynthesis/export family protein [Bacteroidota bacterium]|nr:polysaccharide biosynthesis/export family protein [Bacteroidota bacterium]